MSLFKKKLEILKSTKELADFYRDIRADDNEITGYVRDFNDDWVLLDVLNTENGKSKGISVFCIEDIERVRWGSAELISNKILAEKNYKPSAVGDIEIDSVEKILKTVQYAYGYVNIMLDNNDPDTCFIGKIVELDNEYLVLDEFPTRSSKIISQSLFKLSHITRVDAGADYENGISFLAQSYYTKT